MESWRARGFVPDSDSEDGLDSQETGDLNNAVEDSVVDIGCAVAVVVEDTTALDRRDEAQHEVQANPPQDSNVEYKRPVTPSQNLNGVSGPTDQHDGGNKAVKELSAISEHKEIPRAEETIDDPHRATQSSETPNNRSKSVDEDDKSEESFHGLSKDEETPRAEKKIDDSRLPTNSPEKANARPTTADEELLPGVAEDEGTPRAKEKDDFQLPAQPSNATNGSAPPTPRAKEHDSIWDFPSSEDELQFDYRPSRRPVHVYSRNKLDSQPRQVQENNDLSTPSSPLSSLDSIQFDEDDQSGQEQPEQPEQPTNNFPEDLLPPLDLPEEILREMSPPARRSLRERKAIQLHPYMLEDAKYRTMMRARGVKPVRVAQPGLTRPTGDESQGKEYSDTAEPMSDSFGAEFEFQPSSPIETRPAEKRLSRNSPEPALQHGSPQLSHSPAGVLDRQPKRRKLSRPHHEHRSHARNVQQPSVVIVNSSPVRLNNASIFGVPSPPRSEENATSSPATAPSNVFRFPRGYTPPSVTTNTKSGHGDTVQEHDGMDWSGGEEDGDPVEAHLEANPTQSNSEAEDASAVESENEDFDVRLYQRRIKGVLPASWLRLDQKQQEGRLSATQRQRERMHSRTENAKGVARKITKSNSTTMAPGSDTKLSSLRQLADPDSGDEDEAKDGDDTANSRQLLANLGLEPFDDNEFGDDIPEDNRIDYMLPPAPRAASTKTRQPGKKRPTSQGNSIRSAHAPKRPRMKRQTRLTDPAYGSRKQKRSTPSMPRIGILDAPDVASRSRGEQPLFLRIAAREARSRQDKGRRSPTRKVFNFSSRVDTEDANKSLHDWQEGRLRPTKLPPSRPKAKVAGRQPLAVLSSNRPARSQGRATEGASESRRMDSSSALPSRANSTADEHATSTEPRVSGQVAKTAVNSSRLMQPEQRPNKWIVRRNLAITSLTRQDPRPAMLEVANPRGKPASPLSFQRSLSLINRDYRHKGLPKARQSNLVLDRFISSRSSSPATAGAQTTGTSQPTNKPDARPPGARPQAQRQLKKRPPKRLAVNDNQYQQPLILESTDPEPFIQSGDLPIDSSSDALHGFKPSYSVAFNIFPLSTGTFFHQTTFLGSGKFAHSLEFLKRDLDRDAGFLSFKTGDRTYRWGSWNDAVSSEIGLVLDSMIEMIEKSDAGLTEGPENAEKDDCSLYKYLVKYVTDALSFIDPIDRIGFVRRALSLVCKLNDTLTTLVPKSEREIGYLATICSYNSVFTYQILQISGHDLVDDALTQEALNSLTRAAQQTITLVAAPLGQSSIRKLLANIESPEKRDAGIQSDHLVAEAYVIVRHILRGTDRLKGCFEELLTKAYSSQDNDLVNLTDISRLERVWHCVFTTLPFDELDASGIARIGSRFWEAHGNWAIIKTLLRPVLDRYDATSITQPISYYKYCRTLFHRCFYLINGWGWRDCKSILDTLYDFFARNTLYNLKHEEGYRSPAFLDELDQRPSLEVQPDDPCFHILLKIIASGLRYLAKIYDQKKVRNFAWRLLPNHGRVYPKEKPIRQEDLDALRNHHDLLCTLYYAVPDGCRPRLQTIRDLVHPASSHRETCNISIRSWARLVRFKLSTDEAVSGLEPFSDWHSYFVSELLKQHALARHEVESQNTAGSKFSDQLVERTIAQNQRQIESLLKTALSGLNTAIRSAPTLQHAHKLILGAPIKVLLGLFNARIARVNTTVSETLQVIVTYVQKCDPPVAEKASAPVAVDEDSQEYGDWADIAAAYDESPAISPEIEFVGTVLHPAVFRLISNCFGEDYCPEDAILLNVVECWTSIAQTLVKNGLRHWDSYLSPYNGDSWTSLRLTMQTRKFTPLFLASSIEKDSRFAVDCKVQVIGMWVSCLVERVSMLKYQHRLTEALLNQVVADPLLQNLPFARDRNEGRYMVTLEDLSHRRVSLISSVLSNMRAHLQLLEDVEARELSTIKQEYREIIQNMMSAMKANYLELGNGAASVQGAYVDFVHRIVAFLQQHSRDICPIDPFFTDPASFPLPSGDPTYIVARLKSYEPKLSSEKVAKTLIMFIQSVSERAAIDGQQDYLVNQLHASMADTYEGGLPDKPTLRATLLQAVFPAYLEASFSNPACWILSRPIIQTITLVFQDLLFNMDTTDSACVASLVNIIHSVFQASHTALLSITSNATMLNDPAVAISAAAFIRMITAALPIIDYIDRATDMDQRILAQIHAFQHYVTFATSHLNQPLSTTDLYEIPQSTEVFSAGDPLSSIVTNPSFFPDLQRSAARELHIYLNESWSRHQKKFYFTRRGAHQPQEISIQPSVAAELEQPPQKILGPAVQEFLDVMRGLDLGLDGDDVDRAEESLFAAQHPYQLSESKSANANTIYTLDLVDVIGY
ncbi:uncharacterized protein AKAW2_21469S [Aspergillus luchuensis]|uniref:Mus7/MMS22 family protein n=1 Tax=Aspergillus kawachii TaxID=1069201 RepID=A0A146FMQ3_ASPKA|nr:uncharacterized protein AKAW2_21469S [Aspergillus luchuensis]BCR96529.1 hypothetical protein AKAW2_21469S [Aspergillus luchuensis]BCS09037.1 hypothetical protein ALUC_21407S [Aspergillus luchuensis]GAA82469.1 hypothetical protein AKAW_00584 [Aspergillus luchuensis IFO 4308]GAT26371.1 hypothetical protein RIB2604_02100470 [Aspergillus luchuensis]